MKPAINPNLSPTNTAQVGTKPKVIKAAPPMPLHNRFCLVYIGGKLQPSQSQINQPAEAPAKPKTKLPNPPLTWMNTLMDCLMDLTDGNRDLVAKLCQKWHKHINHGFHTHGVACDVAHDIMDKHYKSLDRNLMERTASVAA